MPDLGLDLPPGHELVSFAERPDLVVPSLRFNTAAWPDFMLEDPVTDEHWHLLRDPFAEFQLTLLDPDGRIAATTNSAPLAWDGTDAGLPDDFDPNVWIVHDLRSP